MAQYGDQHFDIQKHPPTSDGHTSHFTQSNPERASTLFPALCAKQLLTRTEIHSAMWYQYEQRSNPGGDPIVNSKRHIIFHHFLLVVLTNEEEISKKICPKILQVNTPPGSLNRIDRENFVCMKLYAHMHNHINTNTREEWQNYIQILTLIEI